MALLLVAFGAILLWFIIAPFLKPSPTSSPQEFDCSVCDELRDPDLVIEREFGAGRFHYICGSCLASMTQDFESKHGRPPQASQGT